MLYTYRRPHLTNCHTRKSVNAPLSEQELDHRTERRRIPRAIPVPQVIECSDAEAWSLWNRAMELQCGKSMLTSQSTANELPALTK